MKIRALFSTALICLCCGLLMNVHARSKGLDEQLVSKAWKYSKKGNYSEAITIATECISRFEDRAFQTQSQLEKGGIPLPPVGTVSEENKEEIFKMGLIHNVGTALFIVADSNRKAGNLDKARVAYEKLAKLTYARIYDPSCDGFWSPSEKAVSMLEKLK